MTVPELLRKAAACKTCDRPHDYLPARVVDVSLPEGNSYGRTWASPEDGHHYQPPLDPNVIAMLRFLATGKYDSPWRRNGVMAHWWTKEVVKGP